MHLPTDRSTTFRIVANLLAVILLLSVLPGAFALAEDDTAQEESATAATTAAEESADEATTSQAPAETQAVKTADTAEAEAASTSGGANASGPYDSTSDGSPSGNGNGNGNANGKPCAGCVGNADDKNPPGQLPDADRDGNNGYECDGNSGVGKTNPAHSGCQPTTVPTPQPAIRLVKSGPAVADMGDTITYTFAVTNKGDETLNNVHITDPLLAGGSTISVTPSTLPPEGTGVVVTGSATAQLTIQPGHVVNGKVTNTATAHGTGAESGAQVEHSDSHVVQVDDRMHTICHATGQPDKFVVLTANVAGIFHGHLGSHHHDGRDIIPPFQYRGDTYDQNWDAAGQRLFADGCVPAPAIDLTKTGPDETRVGETITYDFEVTNTGNRPLSNVHITDPLIGDADITVSPSRLGIGQSGEATATYTVREEDVNDDDEVPNTATVFGTDPDDEVVSAQDSWVVAVPAVPPSGVPAIDLDKDGPRTAREGDRIAYTFEVTNVGDVTLTDVHVTDPLLGGRLEVTPSTLTATGPGRIGRATATYTITEADAAAGEVLNTAIATGTPPVGDDVHAEDSHRVEVSQVSEQFSPGIRLVKSGPVRARVGETITYRFRVTNTGETVLTDVTIRDDKLGLSDLAVTPSTLTPGASGTASATYTVTEADGRRGFVFNTAIAGGTPPQGPRVTDDDDHRTNVPAVPPGPPVVPPAVPPGPPVEPPPPPLPATGTDAGLQLLAAGLAMLLGFAMVRMTSQPQQAGGSWTTGISSSRPEQVGGSWTTHLDGSSSRRLAGSASPPPVHPRRGRGSAAPA